MPCEICADVTCQGEWNCGVRQILNNRKIELLKLSEDNLFVSLDLSNLCLKSLPPDYFLGIETIVNLPWWTFQYLAECDRLVLADNPKLERVSEALYLIKNVRSIQLSNCTRLADIDVLSTFKTSWVSIDLNGCNIHTVDVHAFENMPHLACLDLSNNHLITFTLHRAKALWGIDLSRNPVRYVDAVVIDLQLENCELTTLTGLLSPRARGMINILGLTYNNLSSLSCVDMKGLNNLTTLGLSNNKIRDLEAGTFTSCFNLDSLDLSHNQLTYLPENLFTTSYMCHLHLQNNNISYIHPLAFDTTDTHIVFTNLSNNPALALAETPPEHVCKGSFLDYLNRLYEAQEEYDAAFHEELMITLMAPERIKRFIETHGMDKFTDLYV